MSVGHNLVRAENVIDVPVKNSANEDLGKIEEIVLDKVNGQVSYVVLSFGGFLGLGEKLFALPWKAISYDKGNDCFILNISKDVLEKAPGFNKDEWPDMANPTWSEGINRYYNQSIQR